MASPSNGPLLVFGPRSLEYDFGPSHPLTPRRFGPGIDLLRAVGAEPGLAPSPASDAEIEWLHSPDYVAAVRRFSADPELPPEAGIGNGDDPSFSGMHEAAATVAGGSLRGMEAILRGDVEHAYQPGGGLHHAMRSRASGFCIYNDPALAIARARRDGLRVLYLDFDVHHGDGVQALHYSDPGVLTISFHESGRTLFPGTGFVDELGEGTAVGTAVNVPFDPMTGPDAWLAAVRSIVWPLAAAFGPDIVVSQHGADGHTWDPLAHLALTTTAMGEAARLADRVAHRYGRGRWLATGGGGYAAYRVVPRVWAMTWLAGAHREVPRLLPEAWMERWAAEAARWRDVPMPREFEDGPDFPGERAVNPASARQAALTVELVRTLTVPAILRVAEERGWWRADEDAGSGSVVAGSGSASASGVGVVAAPVIVSLDAQTLDRLALAPRTIAPADPRDALALLRSAVSHGAAATGAVVGERLVGVALAAPSREPDVDWLAALGVATEWRGAGLGTGLLSALLDRQDRLARAMLAMYTPAERDVFEPLADGTRREIADQALRRAGFTSLPTPRILAAADENCLAALRLPPHASTDLFERARRLLES
jgi:acetoin utilization protein AcuC